MKRAQGSHSVLNSAGQAVISMERLESFLPPPKIVFISIYGNKIVGIDKFFHHEFSPSE